MFYASDLITHYLPWYYQVALHLRSFQLPHWVVDVYGQGYPLLAEGETGILSPINATILFIFPFQFAVNLLYVVYATIGLTGVYLFSRGSGVGRLNSLLGALVFILSGFMVTRYFQTAIIFTAAFLPWGFVLIQKSFKFRNWVFLLAPLIFLQITAGHLQIALISALAYFTFAMIMIFLNKGKLLFLFKILVVLILGFGLSSVQLLPTIKLFALSERKGWDPMIRFSYSLPESHLVTYLFPNAFGVSKPGDDLGFTQLGGGFWELNLTIWTIPFVLSLIPLFFIFIKDRKNKLIVSMYILWACFLLLSFGAYFKPYWLVAHIPNFPFRAPSRFLLVATFAASVLSAYGFELLTQRRKLLIKTVVFTIVLTSIFFQQYLQLKEYFLFEDSKKVINNVQDFSQDKFSTPLTLSPDVIQGSDDFYRTLFKTEFHKGLLFSLISFSVLYLWWKKSKSNKHQIL